MRKIFVAIAALACMVGCGSGPDSAALIEKLAEGMAPQDSIEIKYAPSLEAGVAAPEIAAPDTLGNVVTLADFAGKVVVVDFWASWCRDCRAAIPELKAIYDEFAGRTVAGCPVEFFSVSFDHVDEAWRGMLRSEAFAWPQVCNLIKWKENPISEAYGLHWIPTFYLIGPDGTVLGAYIYPERIREALTVLGE